MVYDYLKTHQQADMVNESFGERIKATPAFTEQETMRRKLETEGIHRGNAAVPREVPINLPHKTIYSSFFPSTLADNSTGRRIGAVPICPMPPAL